MYLYYVQDDLIATNGYGVSPLKVIKMNNDFLLGSCERELTYSCLGCIETFLMDFSWYFHGDDIVMAQ